MEFSSPVIFFFFKGMWDCNNPMENYIPRFPKCDKQRQYVHSLFCYSSPELGLYCSWTNNVGLGIDCGAVLLLSTGSIHCQSYLARNSRENLNRIPMLLAFRQSNSPKALVSCTEMMVFSAGMTMNFDWVVSSRTVLHGGCSLAPFPH